MTTSQIFGFVATGLVIVGYIPQIVLEVFHREVIPSQKQQAVQERARVPGREDEAVAVGP